MKRIILSVAMLSVTFAIAQKKEISTAFKAIESGDNATATAQISAADAVIGDKTYLLEPATLEQYYYTKGLMMMNAGKTQEGASYLAKINDLGKMKIYSGKNDSKEKVYYVGKEAADKSGISGLKEESYTPSTSSKLGEKINPVLKTVNQEAVDAYNSKNYEVAGDKFKETYYLLKAAGTDDKSLLMNSAVSYATAKNLDKSSEIYNELINSGYTGVETTYTAKNKKSGVVDKLDKTSWDLYKKMGATGDYTDFKTETSKSIENNLYTENARNLLAAEKYDETIALTDKGLAKFPDDAALINIKGLAYYKSGKSAQFIEILKKQVAANPKDADNWFNLGLMESKDPATMADAETAYNKALEIKPNYVAALQNLTYMKIGDDTNFRTDYEAARKAGKTEQANKLLDARKNRLLSALPYAEKWYVVDPENAEVVTLLKNLYITAKNDAKTTEFQAKEKAMKAK
ncbi:tetratricopeptide repeat protein [Halpernia frigidisoli]|uniref:Flp pilus assembly protein TadD, contains TPR repeats n=1 Tax=Halpernia frigidisoli TaxID=1125876 RepID=A0A1I3DW76_9FLAO|nr:hypothetical protein [Halpernia frigidisoli]SFH90838.1 Flp pilus assembly protein TadD, contains TPR repeats [Halpernia frigidisoli]